MRVESTLSANSLGQKNVDLIHFGKANAMSETRHGFDKKEAELLAIDALTFLAGQPDALARFLALTGVGPHSLRAAAADPAFLAGVLDHFLANEDLLVAYAEAAGTAPARLIDARRALGDS
jgi:hypothetical protein